MKPERRSTRGRAAPTQAADATAAKPAAKPAVKPAAKKVTAKSTPARGKAGTTQAKASTSKRKAGVSAQEPPTKKKRDATPRTTTINDLPRELLGIIIGSSFETWEASRFVCRWWQEVAKSNPPPISKEMHQAKRIVQTLTVSDASEVQGTLTDTLLLTPWQVKCLGNYRIVRRRGGGVYHIFNSDAISEVIDRYGGCYGLAMRLRNRKLNKKQKTILRRAARRARAAAGPAARRAALVARIEKVRRGNREAALA